MAIKTFTTGEVLTAADTNTYLANAGLDFVKQVTVGSAVATVDVTSCFSSTWENYRVVYSNITPSTNTQDLRFRFLVGSTPSVTGYTYASIYVTLGTTTVTGLSSAATAFSIASSVNTTTMRHAGSLDVFMPNLTQFTQYAGTGYISRTDIGGVALTGTTK